MQSRHDQAALLRTARTLAIAFMSVGICISQTEAQQAANPVTAGDQLPVPGKWVAADHSKLSEHNIEWMQTQPPQAEAEFLLSAAINHDKGATDWINKLVEGWHGKLRRTQKWEDLQDTALYSNDLRVRAAAIEINLAVNNLAKTDETADRIMRSAESNPGNRPWAAWELGMLANRGVEPERIHSLLVTYIHDPEQQTRFWAVEGWLTSAPMKPSRTFWMCFAGTFPWRCGSAPAAAWQNPACSPVSSA
jgi:hypothetical protein